MLTRTFLRGCGRAKPGPVGAPGLVSQEGPRAPASTRRSCSHRGIQQPQARRIRTFKDQRRNQIQQEPGRHQRAGSTANALLKRCGGHPRPRRRWEVGTARPARARTDSSTLTAATIQPTVSGNRRRSCTSRCSAAPAAIWRSGRGGTLARFMPAADLPAAGTNSTDRAEVFGAGSAAPGGHARSGS